MENVLYAGMLSPGQITIIVIAILLLFGGKKIPELMKGMGKGIKGFKDEMKGEGIIDEGEGEESQEKTKK
tara:strand:+ start:2362 stop:2571 length:210 start_codon:yes stop_codon:yes gene_type:complete